MSTKRSIAGILGDLESEISRLEKEEAFHTRQEAMHREKRAACAERLALVRERYDAFRSASTAVGEVVPETQAPVEGADGRKSVIRRLARLVAAKGTDETFTPSDLAAELSQGSPNRPIGTRTASAALRRLAREGQVRVVEEGKPYHETIYARNVVKQKVGKRKARRAGVTAGTASAPV